MEPSTPGAIEPPANVLLVHPKRREPTACEELCRADGETARLTVSFADEEPVQPFPSDGERVGFLVVGDVFTAGADDPDFDEQIVTDSVTDPTDLSAIGVAVSRFCEHWDESDTEIVVCFDSLDALLGHAAPEEVFRFAHVLTTRLSSVDACAHFHFDPTHHEDRIVSTFGTIFDDVVTDDGEEPRPEATDEDVADTLAEWETGSPIDGTSAGTIDEATDEDVAELLGE